MQFECTLRKPLVTAMNLSALLPLHSAFENLAHQVPLSAKSYKSPHPPCSGASSTVARSDGEGAGLTSLRAWYKCRSLEAWMLLYPGHSGIPLLGDCCGACMATSQLVWASWPSRKPCAFLSSGQDFV